MVVMAIRTTDEERANGPGPTESPKAGAVLTTKRAVVLDGCRENVGRFRTVPLIAR